MRDEEGVGGLIFTAGKDWCERQSAGKGIISTASQDWCEGSSWNVNAVSPMIKISRNKSFKKP